LAILATIDLSNLFPLPGVLSELGFDAVVGQRDPAAHTAHTTSTMEPSSSGCHAGVRGGESIDRQRLVDVPAHHLGLGHVSERAVDSNITSGYLGDELRQALERRGALVEVSFECKGAALLE
jgi:hypothetical protein